MSETQIERGTKVRFKIGPLGTMGGVETVRAGDEGRYGQPSGDDDGWHVCTVERGGEILLVPVTLDMVEVIE